MSTKLSLDPTARCCPSGENFNSWITSLRSFMWVTSDRSLGNKQNICIIHHHHKEFGDLGRVKHSDRREGVEIIVPSSYLNPSLITKGSFSIDHPSVPHTLQWSPKANRTVYTQLFSPYFELDTNTVRDTMLIQGKSDVYNFSNWSKNIPPIKQHYMRQVNTPCLSCSKDR